MHNRPIFAPFIVGCVALFGFTVAGCRSSSHASERQQQTASVSPEASTASDYVAAIHTARTPAEEADAIRQLRKWEIDNGLTYQIRNVRTDTGELVADPSVLAVPVRTEVTIYRGRDTVQTFVFTPKANKNLALFGE
jgi:hypothetical protein